MDVVADFRARGRRALDLTDDPAVLTAIANDIGVEAIFARQVIAHGRHGDTLLTLSTSGSSANVLAALGEARRRGLGTIALVGYDGGRIASERLADFVVVVRSEHIPRIQEAQASAYHTLVELPRVRARVTGVVQGVGYRPFVFGFASSSGWPGSWSTIPRACWSRSRARGSRSSWRDWVGGTAAGAGRVGLVRAVP